MKSPVLYKAFLLRGGNKTGYQKFILDSQSQCQVLSTKVFPSLETDSLGQLGDRGQTQLILFYPTLNFYSAVNTWREIAEVKGL